MYIPALNTVLRLTEDWEFCLICEQRNRTLWNLKTGRVPMETIPALHRRGQAHPVQLEKGDELKVRRIFIRQGYEGYNSVTMSGKVKHEGLIRSVRFWVCLADFNEMQAEVINI